MVQDLKRLERRLQEGYQSSQNTWSLGNMASRTRLCVLMRAALYHSSSHCRQDLARELSLYFRNIPNLLTCSQALCEEEGHRDLDVHPLPQLLHGSGERMPRDSPSPGSGRDVGQSTQQCLPWCTHTSSTCPALRLSHSWHIGPTLSTWPPLRGHPVKISLPKLPRHLVLVPYYLVCQKTPPHFPSYRQCTAHCRVKIPSFIQSSNPCTATYLVTVKYNTALKTVTAGRYVEDVVESFGKANHHYYYLVPAGTSKERTLFFFARQQTI